MQKKRCLFLLLFLAINNNLFSADTSENCLENENNQPLPNFYYIQSFTTGEYVEMNEEQYNEYVEVCNFIKNETDITLKEFVNVIFNKKEMYKSENLEKLIDFFWEIEELPQ